jgi:transcriptional regulator with XRE-family HTH domain
MLEIDEKQAFAKRLKQALKRTSKKVETPAQLATQFNLRHSAEPITAQAAQKWLAGTARPTVDKIKTLAEWLDVSDAWLRFGVTDMKRAKREKGEAKEKGKIEPTPDELEIIRRLRSLPAHRREIVLNVLEAFSTDIEAWKQ